MMVNTRDILIHLDELISDDKILISPPRRSKSLAECWGNDMTVAKICEPLSYHEPDSKPYKPVKPAYYARRVYRQSVMRGK